MHMTIRRIVLTVLLATVPAGIAWAANGRTFTIQETMTAQDAYDSGFAKAVMRDGAEAVRLWNHVLIENDAPGSGTSNKGMFTEQIYGGRMLKKVLPVEDPRCEAAHVVIFLFGSGLDKPPLHVAVNGNETTFSFQNRRNYGYIPIKPAWLVRGDNEVVFSCPDARDASSGYSMLIARADEYIAGGGSPEALGAARSGEQQGINLVVRGQREMSVSTSFTRDIGSYSLVSTDGGDTWTEDGRGLDPKSRDDFAPYGIPESKMLSGDDPDANGVVGEYSARLNLQQYVPDGTLISPVIDLWAEPDAPAALIPFTEVGKIAMQFRGSTPQGTAISWQMRVGTGIDPLDEEAWSDWTTIAEGASATVEPKGRVPMPPTQWDPERSATMPHVRYIQWRAVLSTTDPLRTPSVSSVVVEREVTRRMEVPKNIYVTGWHNPEMLYSSTGFIYQSADEPANKTVIERDDLDAILASSDGQFDAMVTMLDYASRRWVYGDPLIEYAKWNAIDIAERAHSLGNGGMCIQHAAYLAHILTAVGFQARHVNIMSHEVVEVWCDEFNKWVYLDPTQGVDFYCYDTRTGEPLDLYELHQFFYDVYNVKQPIDWMKSRESFTSDLDFSRVPVAFSTTDYRIELNRPDWPGYVHHIGFMRMNPRNDFSTTAIPEPLQQGSLQWPWDGYVNWYDELAPPKLQYSRHTDRICDFWPTLNSVRFEAVPEVNGDKVFITMSTFTPSFKTYQVRVDGGEWMDSDLRYNWELHSGRNRLEMRAVSAFGVEGPPSHIELNWVSKPIGKPVSTGTMNQ